MARSSLTWISPPSDIAATLASRTAGMDGALNGLAQNHAAQGESRAKSTTRYQDRTGNLRSSTFGRAEGTDIYIGAGMHYALYIELGTRYINARPFLEPAAMETAPAYFDDAGSLVQRLLGGGG